MGNGNGVLEVAEDQINLLFRKMDEANEELHQLDTRMAILEKASEAHDAQFQAMNILIAENHAKITNILEGISSKVNELSNDYHQRLGAKNFIIKLILPLLSAIAAAAAVFYMV